MSGLEAQIDTGFTILHLRHIGLHLFTLGFRACVLAPMELSHGDVQELGERAREAVGVAQRMTEESRRVTVVLPLHSLPATLTVTPIGKKSWEFYLSLYSGLGDDAHYVRGLGLGRLKNIKEFSDACLVLASEVAR